MEKKPYKMFNDKYMFVNECFKNIVHVILYYIEAGSLTNTVKTVGILQHIGSQLSSKLFQYKILS